VLQHLLAFVRMVVVDGQRGAAGEPQHLAALHLDRRSKRHEDSLVVVRVVDGFRLPLLCACAAEAANAKPSAASCRFMVFPL
jgi:hypothetical protein